MGESLFLRVVYPTRPTKMIFWGSTLSIRAFQTVHIRVALLPDLALGLTGLGAFEATGLDATTAALGLTTWVSTSSGVGPRSFSKQNRYLVVSGKF